MNWKEIWDSILVFFKTAGWKILEFVAIFFIGVIIIKLIKAILKRILYRSPLDNTIVTFFMSLVSFGLYVLFIYILAEVAGIPTSSLVALIAAASLTIGLALQNSLSNLANGIMIVITKPFKEGDYIIVGSIEGKVKAIRMLTTEIETLDRKITIPNSSITGSAIINVTAKPFRRIVITISASYDSDPDKVKEVIVETFKSNDKIVPAKGISAVVESYGDSGVNYSGRAYALQENYWDALYELNESLLKNFIKNSIDIPYNTITIKKD